MTIAIFPASRSWIERHRHQGAFSASNQFDACAVGFAQKRYFPQSISTNAFCCPGAPRAVFRTIEVKF